MLLVPKQLLRSGMTGNVPYYGGRFTPAQAWGASHPSAPPPGAQTGGPPGAPVRTPIPTAQPQAVTVSEPSTPLRVTMPLKVATVVVSYTLLLALRPPAVSVAGVMLKLFPL